MIKNSPRLFMQFNLLIPSLFLFFFFLFTLGYYFSTHIFFGFLPYDAKRVLELILLIGLNGFFLTSRFYSFDGLRLFLHFSFLTRTLLILIVLLGVTSSCLSAVPKMALLEVALYIALFFLTIYVALLRIKYKQIADMTFVSLVFVCALIYLFNFFVVNLSHLSLNFNSMTSFVGFMNLRFFEQYQVWTMFLIFLPLFFIPYQKRFLRFMVYLISAFWFLLVLINFSKGMILALLIATVLVRSVFKEVAKGWLKVVFKVCLLMFLLLPLLLLLLILIMIIKEVPLNVLYQHYSGFNLFILAPHAVSRAILIEKCFPFLIRHPLFGVGPMHFAFYSQFMVAHPHNSVLLIAFEWGWFVLIFSGLLLLRGLYYWILDIGKTSNPVVISLSASFLAGVIYSLFSGVLVTPLSQVMLCLVLGWMLGIYFERIALQTVKTFLVGRCLWVVTFLFAVIMIVAVVSPVLPTLPEKEAQWYLNKQENINNEFAPRFWLQGWINPQITSQFDY